MLDSKSDIISAIFNSLAGGTFLYLACSEIIVEEFSKAGNQWLKYITFFFGVIFITAVTIIFQHEHSHDEHDEHDGHLHVEEEHGH